MPRALASAPAGARTRGPGPPSPAPSRGRGRARSGSSRRPGSPALTSSTWRETSGSAVSATSHSVGRQRAEPLGPQPHLLRRLLGGDVAGNGGRRAASAARAWSSSVDLPMPGSPPSSVTEPGHQPAAEHPVELADAGRTAAADRGASTSAIGRADSVAVRPRRTTRGRLLELLDQGVPRPARRAPARPLRRGAAALAAPEGPSSLWPWRQWTYEGCDSQRSWTRQLVRQLRRRVPSAAASSVARCRPAGPPSQQPEQQDQHERQRQQRRRRRSRPARRSAARCRSPPASAAPHRTGPATPHRPSRVVGALDVTSPGRRTSTRNVDQPARAARRAAPRARRRHGRAARRRARRRAPRRRTPRARSLKSTVPVEAPLGPGEGRCRD